MKLYLVVAFIFVFSVFSAFSQKKVGNTASEIVKAESLMDAGKHTDAIPILEAYLEKDTKNLLALNDIAMCYLVTGRPDMTIRYLERFLSINKTKADIYNLYGLALERQGYLSDAIQYFSKCINMDKRFSEAFFNRGRCYLQNKDTTSALKDFEKAKQGGGINPALYLQSAELNYVLQRYDSVTKDLLKIKKYIDKDLYAYTLLADSYLKLGKNDEAITYYTKILSLDSENVAALNNRAMAYFALDANDKGAADRDKIEEIQKKNGIDPSIIKFKKLVAKGEVFSISLPENWRTFVRSINNVQEVVFFNPEFGFDENNPYISEFGGRILYHPNYFEPDDDIGINFNLRDSVFRAYQTEFKASRMSELADYHDIVRKTFNASETLSREVSKTAYSEYDRERNGLEYILLNSRGELLHLQIWLNKEDFFLNEALLDAIQETLKFKE